MFEHILVPTDFGDVANHALDLALSIASKLEARVTLLHCSWLPVPAYTGYAQGLYWPTEAMTRGAEAALEAALESARRRYSRVQGALVAGEPAGAIAEQVRERHADLIVLGTHGRRGLPRFLLGSVAEKVIRHSPVPVLIVSGDVRPMA